MKKIVFLSLCLFIAPVQAMHSKLAVLKTSPKTVLAGCAALAGGLLWLRSLVAARQSQTECTIPEEEQEPHVDVIRMQQRDGYIHTIEKRSTYFTDVTVGTDGKNPVIELYYYGCLESGKASGDWIMQPVLWPSLKMGTPIFIAAEALASRRRQHRPGTAGNLQCNVASFVDDKADLMVHIERYDYGDSSKIKVHGRPHGGQAERAAVFSRIIGQNLAC